jgi:hypothetical protein
MLLVAELKMRVREKGLTDGICTMKFVAFRCIPSL